MQAKKGVLCFDEDAFGERLWHACNVVPTESSLMDRRGGEQILPGYIPNEYSNKQYLQQFSYNIQYSTQLSQLYNGSEREGGQMLPGYIPNYPHIPKKIQTNTILFKYSKNMHT